MVCTELLVDCEWEDDKPSCMIQPGLKFRQPLSDIVKIRVLTRPISNPRCEPGGSTPEIIHPCQLLQTVRDSQQENALQADKQDRRQQMFYENQHHFHQKVKGKSLENAIGVFRILKDSDIFYVLFLQTHARTHAHTLTYI